MKQSHAWLRRMSALAIAVAVIGMSTSSGFGAEPPSLLDPEVAARLRAAGTTGEQALLAGMTVEVGVEQPSEVVVPLLALNMGRAKGPKVTLEEIRVEGPERDLRATVRPGERLRSSADVAATKPEVLTRLADKDTKRVAELVDRGHAVDVAVPVDDLELTDSTTTTLTATAVFDVAGEKQTAVLPLAVTVAGMPAHPYWSAGDGHVHSSTWSDGWYSVASRASQAVANGHAWLIMTDHWAKIWSVGGNGNANWATYCNDCMKQQSAYGIPVLPGVEIKASSGKSHTLGYALAATTVPPREQYFSAVDLVGAVNAHTSGASYAIAAHPYSLLYPWEDFGARFRAMELMSNEVMATAETQATWFALLRGSIGGKIAGGSFPVGVANTDAHYQSPGSAGITWIRSTISPLTRTAVWNAVKAGNASASGRGDLGFFTLNGVQQGGVAIVSSTGSLAFSITQKPKTGRRCTEISIRDSNNSVVWKVSNPQSTTYSASVTRPSADTFYVVKMVFATTGNTDHSHVWCNPVFVDRR